jgi:hypothetical protein
MISRVMIEGPDQGRIEAFADEIVSAMKKELG